MSKEIVIQKEIAPLVTKAERLTIKGQDDMVEATTVLSKMNKIIDKVTEEKEKVTKPLNEALKAERSRWKPIEDTYTKAITALRAKMSAYQTAELKRAKEEADKIAARVAPGKGKLSVDTAIKKIEAIKTPEKETATDAGLVQFRATDTLKITDETKIPRQYLVINEKAVLAALKAGTKVPGAEIEVIQTPVNFR